MDIEIGIGKTGRRAYGFDEVAIVPSRRTRDPDDVDITWEIDAYTFGLPLLASAMDGVVSPATAIQIGRLGGLGVLNLEGLQTRYDDPDPVFEEIAALTGEKATRRMQELYQEPIKDELIVRRIREVKEAGVVTAASLTPQRVARYAPMVLEAELDILVIQGTVVSAEHVSTRSEPLNLKEFIARFDLPVIVGGCASYQTALHLMRTGAVGVLVGVGPGAACTTRGVLGVGVPQATAIADAAGARMEHLRETGRYVHVIADGGMRTGGDVAKAIAMGADAVMIGSPLAKAYEAPGRGHHWGMATFHPDLPRGTRVATKQIGTLQEILIGPAHENDGTLNLFGALRTSMATTGYANLREFQKAEVTVAPAIKTEGKRDQQAQQVGWADAGARVSDPRPVLVLDFGAQYAQLIARRVREAHVYSEIVPFDAPPSEIAARAPAGLILSGGPASVYEPGAPAVDPALFDLGIPVLGICYGQQAMARALGGKVEATGIREYGRTDITVVEPGLLLPDLPARDTVWMSHSDTVAEAPAGFVLTARTDATPVAGMEDRVRGLYGVQFHPEVAHTPHGQDVLKRFLYEACGLLPEWTPVNVIERAVERIRHQVGDARAICALSGGVDSSVAALLVHRAIGKNLTCVFVDTGLMRWGEGEQVEDTFGRHFRVPLIHLNREELFLERLARVTDPERKRKIIGESFIRVFESAARDLAERGDDVRFLVQGTLYPDVIESGSRTAARIKSHHNVGGLPEDMDFELVEPLRDLFKDEVRTIGEELGLPEEIVWRQPFPGPGLGVRIVGDVTRERLDALRAADAIVQEEIRRVGLHRDLWQVFAVLLAGVRTVGVMGDGRTYQHPAVIRAVTSDDAMTADWARLPYDVVERISSRIVAEVPGINRVALDVTSKPPGTIEWE